MTNGYVVHDLDGLKYLDPRDGVLYRAGGRRAPGTIFTTLRAAKAAIARTKKHAFAQRLHHWFDRPWNICRLGPLDIVIRDGGPAR